jgi:tetratricopeptide (TPR) repeat protein
MTRSLVVSVLAMLLTAFMGCTTPPARLTAPANFGAAVREFSGKRYALSKDLSARLNLPLPPQAEAFFRAATTGTWEAVSNCFEQVKQQAEYGTAIVELRNELWAPIHETMGIWEVWVGWKEDSSLLALFHEPVLASMPKRSIYFGGTDYGRFVITTANAVQKSPPVFCITQNALADNTYAAHLRAVYGTDIWLPKEADSAQAFQRYVEEVRTGKRGDNAQIKIEDGRVHITGVLGVMELNGILCEMIFDHNKATHEFFVEESYVLSWMYPHLEPHGLIMKLNREPVERLSAQTVAQDREFWARYETLLESQPGFAGNTEARKAFSKLRAAIAGVFAYRRMYGDAEGAFRQAIRLFPASPEASFRLAKMYEEQGQLSKATRTMADYLKCALPDSKQKAEEYLRQLQTGRQNNGTEPIR